MEQQFDRQFSVSSPSLQTVFKTIIDNKMAFTEVYGQRLAAEFMLKLISSVRRQFI